MGFPLNIFFSGFIFVYVLILFDENKVVESALEDFFVGLVFDHLFDPQSPHGIL